MNTVSMLSKLDDIGILEWYLSDIEAKINNNQHLGYTKAIEVIFTLERSLILD